MDSEIWMMGFIIHFSTNIRLVKDNWQNNFFLALIYPLLSSFPSQILLYCFPIPLFVHPSIIPLPINKRWQKEIYFTLLLWQQQAAFFPSIKGTGYSRA
jgi:hypothetical protein